MQCLIYVALEPFRHQILIISAHLCVYQASTGASDVWIRLVDALHKTFQTQLGLMPKGVNHVTFQQLKLTSKWLFR